MLFSQQISDWQLVLFLSFENHQQLLFLAQHCFINHFYLQSASTYGTYILLHIKLLNDTSELLFSYNCQEALTGVTQGVIELCKRVSAFGLDAKQRGTCVTKTPFPQLQPTKNPHPTELAQQEKNDVTTQHSAEGCSIMAPFSR